ncbi:very long chain fatty acid elongase AAEL008004 isoform X2 [Anabrus simplex]
MVLVGVYIYGVTALGPKLMRNRKAFKVEGIIRIYNITQIIVNVYMFKLALNVVTNKEFNWKCMPLRFDTGEYSMEILHGCYWFFWLKVYDLMDTVFFILRKKNSQVTFLHVYHHALMVFASWMSLKYLPGGNPILLGFVNVFVHAVMYTYYLLTSIDPKYKKLIWWKKHLTQLQMAQFMLIAIHSSQILFRKYCGYPKFFAFVLVLQNLFIFSLFCNFYWKTYCMKKKS